MEEPGVVDGPELVGRNELLQARERRDLFVVALFGGRPAGGGVTPGEPVARRSPAVRARHLDAVPVALPRLVGCQRGHGVDGGVLPVQIRQDAVVLGEHGGRGLPVAAVGPHEHRRMATKPLDLRAQAVLRDAVVLVVPLGPFLPLVAAHPAVHQRDAHLVGHLRDVIAGELALESNHVEPEVFHVTQDRGVAVGVVRVQQVGRVRGAADQEVLAVDLQIEVSALAEFGELLVLIAVLLDGADAEPQMAGVDRPVVLPELQLQVVEVGLAEGVGPPQVGILHGQLRELVGSEADLALLPRGERDRLLDLDVGLARPGDRRPQNAAHLCGRRIAQAAVDRQPRGIRSRQRKFGVDR